MKTPPPLPEHPSPEEAGIDVILLGLGVVVVLLLNIVWPIAVGYFVTGSALEGSGAKWSVLGIVVLITGTALWGLISWYRRRLSGFAKGLTIGVFVIIPLAMLLGTCH